MSLGQYKPIVKWAGGKSKVVKQLSQYLPLEFNNYHEPFVGSGALFFYLFPALKSRNAKAFLSDLVEELINLYKVVRDNVSMLINISKKHIYNEDYYYTIRQTDPSKLSDIERASRILYLNKTCFNGLYRVNSKGQFNVSFGCYENPRIVDEEALRNASIAFKCAELMAGDFQLVLDNARPGDFVYLDPPYVPLSATANFTGYTRGSFGKKEHERLREVFHELAARGCYIMLSNSNTDFVRKLYSGCNIKTISAARAINSDPTKRGKIKELVILSYPDECCSCYAEQNTTVL
ncbi:Dam family site-specific DNA-(adenine-N6)-methyltransferase [Desulfofundulus thermobenzoicus]|uniref:Site-specific DNA-methyltransferase (adenine-specific) n=1 Tax=Desulfofundulus thermobenzoicus TaxID=29376 RepID=A0A6N7IT75_9FIRM|nr:DNA adenine methylase [Desulfofundulus thermobenzoicus]MQL52763.1 Dam family site-specific DNA-(adenine-N6)-methyltransferase [Desulfofundulus thermobenzoicus]